MSLFYLFQYTPTVCFNPEGESCEASLDDQARDRYIYVCLQSQCVRKTCTNDLECGAGYECKTRRDAPEGSEGVCKVPKAEREREDRSETPEAAPVNNRDQPFQYTGY